MNTIAVMQPYFFPYAGYFRLFAAADTFVILDCVQLPRPGWVHRNRFENAEGRADWLTLPLEKAPYTTPIKDLRLRPETRSVLEASFRRFPVLRDALKAKHPLVARVLDVPAPDLTNYLSGLLEHVTQLLGLSKPMIRSSALGLDPELHGQDRVLAIVKALAGTHYVNAPGGRHLYDDGSFARSGVRLQFLSEYGGSMKSMLSRLLTEPAHALREEIVRESILVN